MWKMTKSQSSDDAPITYFAKRRKIYPKQVSGHFRRLRWLVMAFTLGIYYLAPFLRWDRGAGAPDQAILIDMPHRRAYWFVIEIWPQEVYILTGILIFSAIALFFVTSLFGRVWCGYLCPQTVWTDLYMFVERVVQGDQNARRKLTDGPLTFTKVWKKGLTHILWMLIALCTGGAFVLYFNDAPTLVNGLMHGHISPTVAWFVAGLTFSTYLMAGYAREQVCTYMCPYARFQSAMFDRDTLIIGYDKDRGETRAHHKKGDSWEGRGHCIDCSACVQVCPTGIDIRDGLQMECIACGLCVDACDSVMKKVGLPTGLIRYDSEKGLAREKKVRLLRPRTYYYAALITVVGLSLLYILLNRDLLELHVLHDRNPLYVALSDGNVRNGYEVKILNKRNDGRTFALSTEGIDDALVEVRGAGETSIHHMPVAADSVGHYRVFLSAPPQDSAQKEVSFVLTDKIDGTKDTHQSIFISGENHD